MNDNTLVDRFLRWERTQPDAVYFTQPYPDGSVVDYTWQEVGRQARSMAAYLQSLQLPPESNIAILGKNSAHWIMADLAIWMAGHVSVPLYPTLNAETAQYVFEHCNARVLFVGKLDGKTDGWNEIRHVIPSHMTMVALPMSPAMPESQHWDAIAAAHPPLQEVSLPAPTQLATIMYTSGSTGRPKGVMHSFGTMRVYASLAGEFAGFNTSDRLLSYLPLAHGAERSFVESNSLFHGLRVYFSDTLESFVADLMRARPTVFISVPRLWTKFYIGVCAKVPPNAPLSDQARKAILAQLGLAEVRLAFTGSASLPAHIIEWYRKLGLELLDAYAMTEDFAYSHYARPGQVRVGYVGTPLPGVERRIADNGEIQVKCPTQMMGYYKQPELTAESLTPDGFFKTGDRGETDELGRLKITGRVKELFKTSKGKYVAPVPIENKLTHPKIEAVCVTGPTQPQPFALAMLAADAVKEIENADAREALRAELQALLEEVNATLESHEKLASLVVVKEPWSIDNGFLTPTMKIRRNVIEERYLAKANGWGELGGKVVMEAD
ncbi:AMP-binding protein [Ramlibacter solisilvae]|uniref:AMP-binding acetyl-CoA synthetase n=1 Tax=Ramlibacter tataouinensis TaxID=94132 RepID=A0A127JS53_9BURK|nr:AMP-binding protein [Ramlibacter tataouinensis]AMO22735.1 AMP-binding acetyl-CoA synthetase [Ramlibacter tataouinensis]